MHLKKTLQKIPYLKQISLLAKKNNIQVWLVGGFLRDAFLETRKDLTDFDFCVEKNTLRFARSFRKCAAAKLITLDAKQKSYRVIVNKGKEIYTYDFTQCRGSNLREDLTLRDFTINTLALNLNDFPRVKVLDLLGARLDLAKRKIRVINEGVLRSDPLRILRAFSLAGIYGFSIEKRTLKLLIKCKSLLKRVSGERISEEMFKIFAVDNCYRVIKEMSESFIIDEAIPHITEQRNVSQGGYHHLGVWRHSLEVLFRLETLIRRKLSSRGEWADYFNRSFANKHRLISILKLACLLHDAGKPLAKRIKNKKPIFYAHEKIGTGLMDDVCRRMKLSLKEKEILKHLVSWHLRPGYLADQNYPSSRAIYRFFRDTGRDGVAVTILSLADWRATRGPLVDNKKRRGHERVMFGLINRYFEDKKKKPLPKIINGFNVMKKFKIDSSPLVGKILRKIKEEQALGKITNKHEAYKLAEIVVRKTKKLRRV